MAPSTLVCWLGFVSLAVGIFVGATVWISLNSFLANQTTPKAPANNAAVSQKSSSASVNRLTTDRLPKPPKTAPSEPPAAKIPNRRLASREVKISPANVQNWATERTTTIADQT